MHLFICYFFPSFSRINFGCVSVSLHWLMSALIASCRLASVCWHNQIKVIRWQSSVRNYSDFFGEFFFTKVALIATLLPALFFKSGRLKLGHKNTIFVNGTHISTNLDLIQGGVNRES